MEKSNNNSNFISVGYKILNWYKQNARNLPWRENNFPYNVWISEIILQQTRVNQGLEYYIRFIERFPNVESLSEASTDQVLLYWKGLGYYSRAINLHKASQQIQNDYNGIFPDNYLELQKLKGIGKYTAAAIASICFNEKIPAIDGNFYRVLSRLFADDFDISKSNAYAYFYELALLIMPNEKFGDFNQAIMDLGSEICKPKNPQCDFCPVNDFCRSFQQGKTEFYPVKSKKIKPKDLELTYYFVFYKNKFIIKQRDESFIWKKLFDFPETVPEEFQKSIVGLKNIKHKLTHKNLSINIFSIEITDGKVFRDFAKANHYLILSKEEIESKSFPKPLYEFIQNKKNLL